MASVNTLLNVMGDLAASCTVTEKSMPDKVVTTGYMNAPLLTHMRGVISSEEACLSIEKINNNQKDQKELMQKAEEKRNRKLQRNKKVSK